MHRFPYLNSSGSSNKQKTAISQVPITIKDTLSLLDSLHTGESINSVTDDFVNKAFSKRQPPPTGILREFRHAASPT